MEDKGHITPFRVERDNGNVAFSNKSDHFMGGFDEKKCNILGQGTYACIFGPSITKSGKIGSAKYVSKVQRKPETDKRELEISKVIRTIPHYDNHFAPILESVPVTLGKIDPNEVKKCKFITDVNKTYYSDRIKYVGDRTLAEYFLDIYMVHPKEFIRTFINSHRDLVYSLQLLAEKQIIHYDLKENNIMVEHAKKSPHYVFKPIIIDFGLSYDFSKLSDDDTTPYEELFYIDVFDYPPWNIEITIIAKLIHTVPNWDKSTVTIDQINKLIDQYVSKNPIFMNVNTSEPARITEYTTNLKQYFRGLVNTNNQCFIFIKNLCKNMATWDNYSMAIIYLQLLEVLHMEEIDNNKLLTKYTELIYSVIFAMPDKRVTPEEMGNRMSKLFENVDRKETNKWVKKIVTSQPSYEETIRKKLAEHKLSNLSMRQ